MAERPIIFSGPMVRAIIEGRKTQTRRIIKPQPEQCHHCEGKGWYEGVEPVHHPACDGTCSLGCPFPERVQVQCECIGGLEYLPNCPFGPPGTRLWVRETWYYDIEPGGPLPRDFDRDSLYYRADGECCDQIPECSCAEVGKPRWRSPVLMPRRASRLTLEVVGVRAERVQDISEEDARAEGVLPWVHGHGAINPAFDEPGLVAAGSYRTGFQMAWDSIHVPGAWERNEWVWAVEFKVVEVRDGNG